ncbi:2-dehydropantoate 2-reductase [Beutenbergia cavernae DSM 12333]|uniref:2-dehydropantoate 2-reductase n=1 Tax=Beutenbergia cavernae (strain ATCC BAA-8 / DSM 12333 / CCUG 43141 / JCM 11478 / NBRC 16432 / NCIMB 13614 / HKI 0122) TaxID=471853 RepID=C5C5D0_BEUC1|nr:2-dehydropantoate 2-reductase N-terminal domain-containing protein [Beutenbergia cavernae]ACQ82270.1 2-dehydropantoate 2-reductase [Beutenbergia cavernae DSM 12333]
MRYVIIGAGAVGATIGASLHEAGRDVVLVARGEHLRVLREDGLTFATPSSTRVLPIPAAGGPDDLVLRPDDVLVLATKSQDTAGALAAWAPATVDGGTAGERLTVVCAQNGVDNERQVLRRFGHVVAVTVWLPATHLRPGVVVAPGDPAPGVLTLGRYPSGVDATVELIGTDLAAGGFVAPVRDDVMRWKYAKLLGNLGNAADALFGRDDDAASLVRRARQEGEAALEAAGIPWTSDEEQSAMRSAFGVGTVPGFERGGSSTWQSLARGTGSVEVDYLNGEIVLLGRTHGVPTPVNAALQARAAVAAAAGAAPGSGRAAELLAALAAQ